MKVLSHYKEVNKLPILTGVGSIEPKIGDNIVFLLNEWDGKQFYLLSGDNIWLTFELTRNEKLALLEMLMKDWLC